MTLDREAPTVPVAAFAWEASKVGLRMITRKGLHHASSRGRQNLCMNHPPSSAAALATCLRLRAQLMGHMVERARINPAAPTAGIKTM